MSLPFHTKPPKGNATDPLEKGAMGKYGDDLTRSRAERDHAYWLMKACVAIIAICVIITSIIAVSANYKTYVVRVDNATGQVETGGQLKSTNYQPQEVEIKHFLAQFVTDTRTVPLDPVLFKNNIDRAGHYLTNESANKLQAMLKDNNPQTKLGKMTVQPTIKSIQLQPGSKSTYQVRWTEEEYSLSGNPNNKKVNYVALFTVAVDPPSKEEELLINPLGLKIRDLTVSIESTTTANSNAVASPTTSRGGNVEQ